MYKSNILKIYELSTYEIKIRELAIFNTNLYFWTFAIAHIKT